MRTIALTAAVLAITASLGGCMTDQEAMNASPAQKVAETCHDTALGVGAASGLGIGVLAGAPIGALGGFGINQLAESSCPPDSPARKKVARNTH